MKVNLELSANDYLSLAIFLKNHEKDIFNRSDDFGDLRSLHWSIFGELGYDCPQGLYDLYENSRDIGGLGSK